jgi:integrase
LHRTNGPSAGNNVRASLSAFFSWAMRTGKANSNPVIGSPREEHLSRDRVLTPQELRAIWRALPNDHFGAIVRLLLLTGQRRNEIGDLRWSELHDGQMVLPGSRTKNGLTHVVPLSDQAFSIVKAQPRRLGASGKLRDLIFGIGDGSFSGWSKAKAKLDDAIAGALGKPLPAWVLHDLRRSVATYMGGGLAHALAVKLSAKDRKLAEGLGVQPHVIEAVLNHVSGHKAGVAGVYQRGTYESEKRVALDQWSRRLQEIVNSTNVASLGGVA